MPFPIPGNLINSEDESASLASLALVGGFLPLHHIRESYKLIITLEDTGISVKLEAAKQLSLFRSPEYG